MRKYFLTCAVALMTATSVNALPGSQVNIDVTATLQGINVFNCSELKFGTIMYDVTSEEYPSRVEVGDEVTYSGSILAVQGAETSKCTGSSGSVTPFTEQTVTLNNAECGTLTAKLFTIDQDTIGGYIEFTEKPEPCTYSGVGTFTIIN